MRLDFPHAPPRGSGRRYQRRSRWPKQQDRSRKSRRQLAMQVKGKIESLMEHATQAATQGLQAIEEMVGMRRAQRSGRHDVAAEGNRDQYRPHPGDHTPATNWRTSWASRWRSSRSTTSTPTTRSPRSRRRKRAAGPPNSPTPRRIGNKAMNDEFITYNHAGHRRGHSHPRLRVGLPAGGPERPGEHQQPAGRLA